MHQTRRSLQIARWFCRQEAIVSDVLSVAFIKFDEVEQNAFIAQVLHDPVTSRFPTSLHFRRKLLREAIRRVEYHGQPLTDDLVSEYTNLLLPNTNAFNGVNHWSYKTFTYGNFQTKQEDGFLQVRCSRNMLEGETGCKEWEAGILLGEYILNHHSLFKDRIVMELGCGVGLTGVCVMRQNPFHLILTDGNEEALDNCRRNLESNDICLSKSVSLRKFLWSEECEETPEIIIGSDLLYDTNTIPSLVGLIQKLLSKKTDQFVEMIINEVIVKVSVPFCLLMNTVRNESTLCAFHEAIKTSSLTLVDISCQTQNLETQFFSLVCRQCNVVLYLIH